MAKVYVHLHYNNIFIVLLWLLKTNCFVAGEAAGRPEGHRSPGDWTRIHGEQGRILDARGSASTAVHEEYRPAVRRPTSSQPPQKRFLPRNAFAASEARLRDVTGNRPIGMKSQWERRSARASPAAPPVARWLHSRTFCFCLGARRDGSDVLVCCCELPESCALKM